MKYDPGIDGKRVAIDAADAGDNTLVAAVAGRKIRVIAYTLVAAGAVDAKLTDGAGGDDLTGAMTLAASTPVSPPESLGGHAQTSANTALVLNLSAAVQVSGHLTYVLVD